jgi:hypothetical protein
VKEGKKGDEDGHKQAAPRRFKPIKASNDPNTPFHHQKNIPNPSESH